MTDLHFIFRLNKRQFAFTGIGLLLESAKLAESIRVRPHSTATTSLRVGDSES